MRAILFCLLGTILAGAVHGNPYHDLPGKIYHLCMLICEVRLINLSSKNLDLLFPAGNIALLIIAVKHLVL